VVTTTAPSPRWTGRPRTTQEHVLAELRRRILTGEVAPGDAIRPDVVAAELAVSRVPVREALKILEGEGQVDYRPHHGYTLAELRIDDLREIYRLRELLEGEAVRVAVRRLDEGHLDEMRRADDEMWGLDPGDRAGIAAMAIANRRFHFVPFEAAAMPHLLHVIDLLWNATDHYRSVYYLDDADRRQVRADHARIMKAARARDGRALRAAMDEHRRHAIDGLWAHLEEETTT